MNFEKWANRKLTTYEVSNAKRRWGLPYKMVADLFVVGWSIDEIAELLDAIPDEVESLLRVQFGRRN